MTKNTWSREFKWTVFKCCFVNTEIIQSGTGNRMHRAREHICHHRNWFLPNAYKELKLGVRFSMHRDLGVFVITSICYLYHLHETMYHPICSNALAEKEEMDSEVILSQARPALLGKSCLITSCHDDDFVVFPIKGNKR